MLLQAVPVDSEYKAMHYQQTTDESVCCQIFPGMLQAENDHAFNISNNTFWLKEPNPWQIIFDGYKSGIKPGKQGVQVGITVYLLYRSTTISGRTCQLTR